jgi:hypothetical protein
MLTLYLQATEPYLERREPGWRLGELRGRARASAAQIRRSPLGPYSNLRQYSGSRGSPVRMWASRLSVWFERFREVKAPDPSAYGRSRVGPGIEVMGSNEVSRGRPPRAPHGHSPTANPPGAAARLLLEAGQRLVVKCVVIDAGTYRPVAGQTWLRPPSISRLLPVMKVLWSEARNSTASATSSGRPIRPRGTWLARYPFNCATCSSLAARPVA